MTFIFIYTDGESEVNFASFKMIVAEMSHLSLISLTLKPIPV